MKILGVHCSHDSGAAIIEDGKILCAINEERLNRIKLFWGFPALSLRKVFEISEISPQEIDYVALANITPGMGSQESYDRPNRRKWALNIIGRYPFPLRSSLFVKLYRVSYSKIRRGGDVRNYLRELGVDAPLHFVEHHYAHAASAFYTSNFGTDALVVTADGMGDGYCATVNAISDDFEIQRVASTPFGNSVSAIYGYVTRNIGFKSNRHEGKITGLAAYGDPTSTYDVFKGIMGVRGEEFVTRNIAFGWSGAKQLHMQMQFKKIENIAAGLQKRIEEVCTRLVRNSLAKHHASDIALAGGLFANVKVNQRIAELEEVRKVYIHPHMGDGGLAVGSALALWADKLLDKGVKPEPVPINAVYFGPEFSDDEICSVFDENALKYRCSGDIEQEVAELIKAKRIVGRFHGRMEYGPRALGNRSILADATDRDIIEELNRRKERTDFMPFAPSILRDYAEDYYKSFSPGEIAAKFMAITFDATDEGRNSVPAVCHVDNTARPQTVEGLQNESYYKLLRAYRDLTGIPLFLNTSFNMHEEPIVCSPYDAVQAFKTGIVDCLAIGNFLCSQRK
jgi:carbamoyltransferase